MFHACRLLTLAGLIGLVPWSDSLAQSIDPTSARLSLHRPFALRLLIRADNPERKSSVNACIEADFQSGNTRLVSDDMTITLRAAERPGWYEALFTHPHVVSERPLLAHIILRCPARFEREFVIQASPVGTPVATAAVSDLLVRPPVQSTLVSSKTARSQPPLVATETRNTQRHTRNLLPQAIRVADTPPPAIEASPKASNRFDATALQLELAQLKHELAQLRRAQTPARPASSVEPNDPPATWLVSASLGWLLIPVLGLLPLAQRRFARSKARIHTMEIAFPRQDGPIGSPKQAPVQAADSPRQSPPPSQTTGQRAPLRAAASHRAVQPPEGPSEPEGLVNTHLIPPTVIPRGAASLADRGAALFTHHVDQLVQDGYMSVAVNMLEKALDAGPAKNPWQLLQLLDLYERLGQLSEAARLIATLQTLYRVHLPMTGGVRTAGQSLLDHPTLLTEVTRAWDQPDLAARLEDWLLGHEGPSWDLATFEDLLLLHAVATNRPDSVALPTSPPTPQFEPILEWTIDDR